MGILDIILGRDEQGNASKINMALIALLLWRWYQSTGRSSGGSAEPIPVPSPGQARIPTDTPARVPGGTPAQIPTPGGGSAGDSDLGPLLESMNRMPDYQRGGGAGGGGMGGGLGDILGDILGGGRGAPGGGGGRGGQGGGLGDILGDILGGGRAPGARFSGQQDDPFGALSGLLAGGAAGGMLGDLVRQFEQSGQGEAAQSWVSGGENVPVTPDDIENTFGPEIISQIADQFGIDRNELLQGLSQTMPQVVDQLTPEGHLPTAEDISRWR